MISLDNGTICISATETALHCCVFQAVEEFNRQYPTSILIVKQQHNRFDPGAESRKNRYGCGLLRPSSGEGPLKIKPLRSYHDILIGGSKFQYLKGREITLEELKNLPWISLTSGSITRDFLNRYFASQGLTFDPNIELATTDMILPAIRHNLGIGFVPRSSRRKTCAEKPCLRSPSRRSCRSGTFFWFTTENILRASLPKPSSNFFSGPDRRVFPVSWFSLGQLSISKCYECNRRMLFYQKLSSCYNRNS